MLDHDPAATDGSRRASGKHMRAVKGTSLAVRLLTTVALTTMVVSGAQAAGEGGAGGPHGGAGGSGNGYGGSTRIESGNAPSPTGAGGAGGNGNGPIGGPGGTVGAVGTIGLDGPIQGQDGGAGMFMPHGGAGGGGGGAGLVLALSEADHHISNFAIAGGRGGNGGDSDGIFGDGSGGGGGGGAGLILTGAGGSFTSTDSIKGGSGGIGGRDFLGTGGGGGGGGGGDAVLISGDRILFISEVGSQVWAGSGNFGLDPDAAHGFSGSAVNVVGSGNVIRNYGAFYGGQSNYLSSDYATTVNLQGNGNEFVNNGHVVNGILGSNQIGVQVTGDGNSVVNGGTINGAGSSPSSAYAVRIQGDNNSVELRHGGTFQGIVSASGSENTFILGGDTDGSFDVARIGNDIVGFTDYAKTGASRWMLDGTTTAVTPWQIREGTLYIHNEAALGDINQKVTLFTGAKLETALSQMTRSLELAGNGFGVMSPLDHDLDVTGLVTGSGGLQKSGISWLTLSNVDNSFTGGLFIEGGRVSLANDGARNFSAGTGKITIGRMGELFTLDDGVLLNDLSLAGAMAAAGGTTLRLGGEIILDDQTQIGRNGAGTVVFDKAVTFGHGPDADPNIHSDRIAVIGGTVRVEDRFDVTNVEVWDGATLIFNGSTATDKWRDISVYEGGTLLGTGSAANVDIAGGTLRGNQNAALSMASLTVRFGGVMEVALDAPSSAPVFDVTGSIELSDSTLNIVSDGPLGDGLYRIISYGDRAHAFDVDVIGADGFRLVHKDRKVDLTNIPDAILNIWVGNDTTLGGDGIWGNGAESWTDLDGVLKGPMTPQPGFAVFDGAAGTVTIDGSASAAGMQFKTSGYVLAGGSLELSGDNAAINVDGADSIATINSQVGGHAGLEKQGKGTLFLGAYNYYDGKTTITAGTLALTGGAQIGSSRLIEINEAGTFDISATDHGALIQSLTGAGKVVLGGQTLSVWNAAHQFAGGISGSGGLRVNNGMLTLSGINDYTGGTEVHDAAALNLIGGGSIAQSAVTMTNGRLIIRDSDGDVTIQSLSGSGDVLMGDHNLVIANASGAFDGVIGYVYDETMPAPTGGLIIQGGEMELSRRAGYTGLTDISGTLRLTDEHVIDKASHTIIRETGLLDLGGAAQSIANITLEGGSLGNGYIKQQGKVTSNGGKISNFQTSQALEVLSGTTTLSDGTSFNEALVKGGTLDLRGGAHHFGDGSETFLRLEDGTVRNGDAGVIIAGGGRVEDMTGSTELRLRASGKSVTLAGTNSYWGDTDVFEGVLIAGNDDAFSRDSFISVGANGVIDLGGYSQTLDDGITVGRGQIRNGALHGHVQAMNATISDLGGTASVTIDSIPHFNETVLTGTNAYSGPTTVNGGAVLRIAGDLTQSSVKIGAYGTLTGNGTIGKDVTIADNGALFGMSGSTLRMGSLVLNERSVVNIDLSGDVSNDALFAIDGNLTLDGTLNIAASADLSSGIYRVMSYGGTLTDNGLELGDVPGKGYVVRNAGGFFDIINTNGLELSFWNGKGTTTGGIAGGSGVWSQNGTNWTDANGTVNAPMNPQPGMAIFEGEAGTITVEGPVSVAGMQFVTSGYVVEGDPIKLAGESVDIRVGARSANDAATTATIRSELTGAAGITKRDSGTLVLTGFNSYHGETNIAQGTLALQGAGSITGSKNVVVDGTLDISGADVNPDGLGPRINGLSGKGQVLLGDRTLVVGTGETSDGFSGRISGTGGLGVRSGKLVLSGQNDYTGVTQIGGLTDADPILSLVGAGSIANSSRVIVNNILDISGTDAGTSIRSISGKGTIELGDKTLTITAADSAFLGNITGAGGLTLTGGTLTFAGSNDYTGDTVITNATLIAGEGLTDVFSRASHTIVGIGGTLDLAGQVQRIDNVRLDGGTLRNGEVDGLVVSIGGSLIGVVGDLDVYARAGDGMTSVDANSTINQGFVEGGTLSLQGTANGTIEVQADGVLQGTGTMGGLIVRTAGTLAPGNSIGTLHVAGNALFEAGSAYQVEIDEQGGADLLDATGTVTIEGGVIDVIAEAGEYRENGSYEIIRGADGIDGTFDEVTKNLAFLDVELRYAPNSVWLDTMRNDVAFDSLATSRNGRAVATQAQALASGHAVYDAIVTLPDDGSPQRAFDALSGEVHASVMSQLIEESRFLRATALRHSRAPSEGGHTGLWMEGMGNWANFDGNRNTASVRANTGGMLAGVDIGLGDNFLVGAAGGWSKTDLSITDRQSKADAENVHLAGYARARAGKLGVRLGAAYSWHDLSTTRELNIAALSETLEAGYDARTFQAFGELGYGFTLKGAQLEPYVGVAHVDVESKAFAEDDGAAALAGDRSSKAVTYSTLGTRMSLPFATGPLAPVFRGKLEWQHAFGNRTPISQLRFVDSGAGAGAFGIAGAPIGKDAAIVEAGVDVGLARNVMIGASYSGRIADQGDENRVSANLSIRF